MKDYKQMAFEDLLVGESYYENSLGRVVIESIKRDTIIIRILGTKSIISFKAHQLCLYKKIVKKKKFKVKKVSKKEKIKNENN